MEFNPSHEMDTSLDHPAGLTEEDINEIEEDGESAIHGSVMSPVYERFPTEVRGLLMKYSGSDSDDGMHFFYICLNARLIACRTTIPTSDDFRLTTHFLPSGDDSPRWI